MDDDKKKSLVDKIAQAISLCEPLPEEGEVKTFQITLELSRFDGKLLTSSIEIVEKI